MPAKKKRSMSAEHKAALAVGRQQGRIVRDYLEALEAYKPKRGRKRTPATIGARLEAIDSARVTASPLQRLELVQERLDLEDELAVLEAGGENISELEAGFVEVAAEYSDRKGISYTAWRQIGVDASVLRSAGLARSS